MKLLLYFHWVLLFSSTIVSAQFGCVPTALESNTQGFVCSDQIIGPYINKIYKIRFSATDVLNIHTISTVGETDEDTELYLYDDLSNTILAYNDDDANCGGCKQSTIVYNENSSNHRNLYVVIAKKGCNVLALPTKLKFNARNPYNTEPRILSPLTTIQCIGSTDQFTYDPLTTSNPSPWSSLTPSTVTINPTTGVAKFLTTGIAKIQLSGNFGCDVQNNYIVKGSLTSTITSQ